MTLKMTQVTYSLIVSIKNGEMSPDEVFEIPQDRAEQAISEMPSVVLISFSESESIPAIMAKDYQRIIRPGFFYFGRKRGKCPDNGKDRD
jgi:hypothetical protein